MHRLMMMMMQTSGGGEDVFLAGVRTHSCWRVTGSRQDPKVMRQKKSCSSKILQSSLGIPGRVLCAPPQPGRRSVRRSGD